MSTGHKFVGEVKKIPASKVFTSLNKMLKDQRIHLFHSWWFISYAQKSLETRAQTWNLCQTSTSEDLFKLELNTAGVYLNPKDLDQFNSAKSRLWSTKHGKDQKSVLKFMTECLDFLKATIKKNRVALASKIRQMHWKIDGLSACIWRERWPNSWWLCINSRKYCLLLEPSFAHLTNTKIDWISCSWTLLPRFQEVHQPNFGEFSWKRLRRARFQHK